MKRWYLAGGTLLALVCLLSIGLYFMPEKISISEVESQIAEELSESAGSLDQAETGLDGDTVGQNSFGQGGLEEINDGQSGLNENPEPYKPYSSPIDFEALWKVNPDIYAWLYIPGTNINYPLLQREGDGAYYLDHNSECRKDKNGALFTESKYNHRDFSDPATAVYGHHMRSGAMFGQLQALYSKEDGLETYRDILVYLPDQEQHYEAFAALPFENDHILYYYDFRQESGFNAFLNRVNSVRRVDAHIDSQITVTPEDQILILSTCLSGNNKKRYLVLARRTEEIWPGTN